MIVALIDNGSVEPAAHLNLRKVAAALAAAAGVAVHAVSWKHSDRAPADALGGVPGTTLAPWLTAQLARGERTFVFVPFFISAQGAIGSGLRADLENLQATAGEFSFVFTGGLVDRGGLPAILADRVRETIATNGLDRPPVIFVDHGGPSLASAALRDQLASATRALLGQQISALAAASMEGAEHRHNRPLLADQLVQPGFGGRELVVSLLFLSPGRHAGTGGDVAEICRAAEAETPGLRCHLTGLVGTHPGVIAPLVAALRQTLADLPASPSA